MPTLAIELQENRENRISLSGSPEMLGLECWLIRSIHDSRVLYCQAGESREQQTTGKSDQKTVLQLLYKGHCHCRACKKGVNQTSWWRPLCRLDQVSSDSTFSGADISTQTWKFPSEWGISFLIIKNDWLKSWKWWYKVVPDLTMRRWASIVYEICWAAHLLLITCKECLDRSSVHIRERVFAEIIVLCSQRTWNDDDEKYTVTSLCSSIPLWSCSAVKMRSVELFVMICWFGISHRECNLKKENQDFGISADLLSNARVCTEFLWEMMRQLQSLQKKKPAQSQSIS
jgi:hypothetical protein